MEYPNIVEIQKICDPIVSGLGEEYKRRYREEIKDLKKWVLFVQTDKAKEVLEMKGNGSPTNKSGSVILWMLGASTFDPVKNGIPPALKKFGKADPPDIDMDLMPDVRNEVKAFLVEKFGQERVCSVGTVGTYKTKNVILDVARGLGLDVQEAMEVTKNLDAEIGVGEEEEETKLDKAGFDEICNAQPELAMYFENHPEVREHAEVLRNQAKNFGTHAGGVIISNLDLTERIPVYRDKEGRVVSSWSESGDKQELSSQGYIKFDILGLCNLPIIDKCIKLVKENRGIELHRKDIPVDDHESIKMGTRGELLGIFQFENPYTKKIADKVGCDCLGDIAAITSLIRPGPKDVGLDVEYAERKNGKLYDKNPVLEKVLGKTYGVLTFQEQIQKLAIEMAGMSPLQANSLRKASSKKKVDLMAKLKPEFINGSIEKCVKTGLMTEAQVNDIWNMIESMAGYAFNASHAICYSAITTTELWLRYHYFYEYMTALLQNSDPKKEKFGTTIFDKYVKFAIDKGMVVHKPDINESRVEFRLEGNDLWYALGHVKNVSNSASAIVRNQPYQSMEDFYERCTVEVGTEGKTRRPNTRVVESLIYGGAFDCFGDRETVFKRFYELTDRVEKWKLPRVHPLIKTGLKNSEVLQGGEIQVSSLSKNLGKIKKAKAVVIDQEISSLRELNYDSSPKYIDLPPLDEKTLEKMEQEMLSVRLSENLYAKFRQQTRNIKNLCSFTSAKLETEKTHIKVLGKIMGIKDVNFKSGNQGLRVYLNDGNKEISFPVFTTGMVVFKDHFMEGDIAVIPLRNFGTDTEDKTFRFYDDKEVGFVLKREENG